MMQIRKFVLTIVTVIMVLSFPLSIVAAIPPAREGSKVDFVWTDPMPYYPVEQVIFDKTPEFRFSQYEAVTKYRIKVRNYEDQEIEYYTYKGTATCVDFECWMTPDIPLAGGVITFEQPLKGYYEWTVEAKVAPGVWSGVQDYAPFGLATTGFDSQFTNDKKGWVDLNGDWLLTSNGYLKNSGTQGEYTSSLFKKRVSGDFTYTVMMKLKSVDSSKHYGGIILDGSGLTFDSTEYPLEKKVWWRGTYFLFKNNQNAAIFVWEGGTITGGVSWRQCSSIIPGGWNKIKVTTIDDTMYVDVNGTACLNYTHPAIENSGYAGLTQYRFDAEAEKMLVDWARLEVDTP